MSFFSFGKKPKQSEESKERINWILQNCISYKVGDRSDFRIPSVRLCPSCKKLVEIIESSTQCKHVPKCPWCEVGFCACCLLPQKNGSWQCGGPWDKCTLAKRQQIA
mmetsp:Transcript_10064/g.13822  ORF Transcript_10064/g.13822 Transcript_10064/m.13822 type:complete len:107 (-) Transcript_10064:98-418(-)